jgi:uncharacterized Rmd1/YagE family protein
MADLQAQLEATKQKLSEERFTWILIIVILFDVITLPQSS